MLDIVVVFVVIDMLFMNSCLLFVVSISVMWCYDLFMMLVDELSVILVLFEL